jgi:hypothetical protein
MNLEDAEKLGRMPKISTIMKVSDQGLFQDAI